MNRSERWALIQILGREPARARRPVRLVRRGPARNAAYLAWVRSLPCAIPGCGGHSEAAHTGHDGGGGLKPSDYSAVPLCHVHHRTGPHAYHGLNGGRRALEAAYCIDFDAIAERLNAEWAERGQPNE